MAETFQRYPVFFSVLLWWCSRESIGIFRWTHPKIVMDFRTPFLIVPSCATELVSFHLLLGRPSQLPWASQCHRTSIRGEEPWCFPMWERKWMKHLLTAEPLLGYMYIFEPSMLHTLSIDLGARMRISFLCLGVYQQTSSRWSLERRDSCPTVGFLPLCMQVLPPRVFARWVAWSLPEVVLSWQCAPQTFLDTKRAKEGIWRFFSGLTNEIASKRLKDSKKKLRNKISINIY